jgi:hypothetical protein
MLDRSTPNLFHTNPSAAEAPTAVIHDKRPRAARPAPGARGNKSSAGLSAPRLSSIGTQALRGAASRLGGFKRYLPLSIALSFVLLHDLGGAGHRAAPVSSATASAQTVKPTVIPQQRVAAAHHHAALPVHPAARRPRSISRPAQAHAAHRVIYPRRVVSAPTRFAAPTSPPAQSQVTPTVARSPAPAASTATARTPSERSEFGFES